MKIGVFDSGVGGLSVLKSLIDARLFSEIIYYGDTARVPYGNKDKATIVRFSLEAVDFFIPHKIDMLIVACNTASAYALKDMQKIAPFPVIGVVESGVLSLSNKIKNKKDSILIIATKATIKSGIYEKELRKLGYENITSLQTGLFVPLVEEGVFEGELLEATFRHYFGDLNNPCEAPETRPLRGAKNQNQASSSASADFLLEAEKRGSPPKSEKRQLLARRGSEVGGAALLRKESNENNGNKIAESTRDSSPTAQNDKVCGKVAESSEKKDTFATPKAIILACTHFPLIAHQIRAYFDNKPILIHSGEAIVEFLLKNYKLDSAKKRAPKVQFYASADRAALQKTAKLWLKS